MFTQQQIAMTLPALELISGLPAINKETISRLSEKPQFTEDCLNFLELKWLY
jgi:hypothetical protein